MSNKYSKLIKLIDEEKEFKENQIKLHNKHKDIDKDKVIVEKTNTLKFILSFLANIIKITSEIILIMLASIGIISLIYKEPREELIIIFNDIYQAILSMF